MSTIDTHLFRCVREAQFSSGTIVDDKPVSGILYPDFEAKQLPNGTIRAADVTLSANKEWVEHLGGTSLFDKANVFKSKGWLCFFNTRRHRGPG